MHIHIYLKYPLFLSDFSETWIFSTDFSKILKYQISWKSVQWDSSSCKQTDRHDEPIVVFRNWRTRLTKTEEFKSINNRHPWNQQHQITISWNRNFKKRLQKPSKIYILKICFNDILVSRGGGGGGGSIHITHVQIRVWHNRYEGTVDVNWFFLDWERSLLNTVINLIRR
jgi:hypothetical protein